MWCLHCRPCCVSGYFWGFSGILSILWGGIREERALWTECLCPPSSCVEVLIPNKKIFGSGVSGKWWGLDEAMRVETPWWDFWFNRRECEHGHCKPGGGFSADTTAAGADLGGPASRIMRNTCLFKPPNWYFVIAAKTD